MRALTLAFLFVLTACQDASAPPPPPDYPAPNHQIARRAYMAALQFDGHDNLASETRAERMSASGQWQWGAQTSMVKTGGKKK